MDPVFGGIADALPFLVLLVVAVMVHIEEKEAQEKGDRQAPSRLDLQNKGTWKRIVR
jgi:hypothetical protein